MTTLDRIDFEIVAALSNNARLSNKELAAHVGLAQSTCLLRFRRLVESGVLRGFHADVDPAAFGGGLQAAITVRLSEHSRASYAALRDKLISIPRVLAIYHLAGRHDFIVHVAVGDVTALRDFVVDEIAIHDEVGHIETNVIFEYVRTGTIPTE